MQKEDALIFCLAGETVRIEAWGNNALRIRATKLSDFSGKNQALSPCDDYQGDICLSEEEATIQNGKIKCVVGKTGCLTFYKDNQVILKEYYRDVTAVNEKSTVLTTKAREYQAVGSTDFKITLRFEANEGEKIYGMGQYQQPNLNLSGCVLELAQKNSQISIPFYLSSSGYGFLWNNPCVGEVMFGANCLKWQGEMAEEFDYWITADDTPKDILKNYTEVTGRAPEFPESALGLWQCKLRYRTQEELLSVAREYKKRGIPLDVIVIDYFHWVYQGDWEFDPAYWPDPQAMVDELKEIGVRCVVSVWPTVEKRSKHFDEMADRGLLVRTERGFETCMDFLNDTVFFDATKGETKQYVWDKIKKNYCKYGIDMFWLDVAEPEFTKYNYENYRYCDGSVLKVGNQYPRHYSKLFYDGLIEEGHTDIVNLVRSAWVGSQKYAALVWSGDIRSNFATLRDHLSAGLNSGIAGSPWWTTDTGGFHGDVTDDGFNELLVRWFQFSTFCPVLRMHGDRGPHDIPLLSELNYGGGFCPTGRPNELWSYGEDVYQILRKYLDIRLDMKPYIQSVMKEASENGSPVIRTMFYEFPEDEACWNLSDQYMFGPKYLVAPVMYQDMRERKVYFPDGKWRSIHTGEIIDGKQTLMVSAPLEIIPVYEKIN